MVTVLQNVIGLLLAFLLNQKLWLIKFGRTISFLPVMLSPLIIGVVFTAVLHPNGVFNGMLRAVGLGMFVKEWLGNPDVVMNALVGVNVWQYIGFSMMIFLAGMQSVPQELLECARVEGASSWQVATRITLPLIAPSTTVNIFLSLIGSLKVFDLVMMLTQGGPGTASMVFLVSIYKSLATGLYGLGVAANLVLFVIILAITLVVLPALRRREVEIH